MDDPAQRGFRSAYVSMPMQNLDDMLAAVRAAAAEIDLAWLPPSTSGGVLAPDALRFAMGAARALRSLVAHPDRERILQRRWRHRADSPETPQLACALVGEGVPPIDVGALSVSGVA